MADINGRSFIATLQSAQADVWYPVGFTTDAPSEMEGWLIQCKTPQAGAMFQFDFIRQSGTRLYYNISGAPGSPWAGAKLGVSSDGYVGFYTIASVTDPWKIELVLDNSHPDYCHFYLRDHRGHRIGAIKEWFGNFSFISVRRYPPHQTHYWLNVDKGDVLYFQAHILEYL
ncbi:MULTISPECIES: hypothetical protein [Pseudomonas]|uniref:Uncharacterized protein n=1 Tax=Pseudomonas quercus TaxID=2722792 RepID=A0ABX0YCH4_9PSED|nr:MULTISPECIES: hypothetical protein [Pseudomonas]MBF7142526.1 hypothetical protein [Pseudomonas sp. LY10J]NJP01064.1 hypothetical protein [Pseudomonas quercus]